MRAAVGWLSSDSTGRSVDPRDPAFRRTGGFPSPAERRRALAAVVTYLRCPACAGPVSLGGGRLACGRGHSFDLARQGYANLTAGRTGPGTADTTAMVAARDRFLSGGHYQPLAGTVMAAHCDHRGPGLAIDLAGALATTSPAPWTPCRTGTACALTCRSPPCGAPPGRTGGQRPSARTCGSPLPLAARSAAVVLSIFGPRNAAETSRILTPDGTLILAVPGAAHLRELTGPLGMIGIDQRKPRRLAEEYRGYAQSELITVKYQLKLDHADLTALVTMGPSARHITPQDLAAAPWPAQPGNGDRRPADQGPRHRNPG